MTARLFVSPNGTGDGTGRDPANTLAVASGTGRALAKDWLEARQGDTPASSSDLFTWTSVVPGIDTAYDKKAPDGGLRSYIPRAVPCLIAAEMNWVTDAGEYDTGVSSPWMTLGDAHGGTVRSGTVADPHRLVRHVGYRRSDAKRTYEVPGGQTTRSVTMQVKDPSVDWNSTSYYSGGEWVGPTISRTFTWKVASPSPIRARFKGSRAADPRLSIDPSRRHRMMWGGGDNSTREHRVGDPDSHLRDDILRTSGGTQILLIRGDVFDLDKRTKTNHGFSGGLGNFVFRENTSCTLWQGFEFTRVESPWEFNGNPAPTRFNGFLDVYSDNTRYGIVRGHQRSDVLVGRWHNIACAQKLFSVGADSWRWYFHDQYYDGAWVFGDGAVQGGIQAAADKARNSGIMRVDGLIAEHFTSGVSTGSNLYVQGDPTDIELRWGWAINHSYAFNSHDGLVDSKSGCGFGGWNAAVVTDSYTKKVKRSWRSWAPPGDMPMGRNLAGPWQLRDCTHEDARDTGLVTFNRGSGELNNPDKRDPFDKVVTWENPSGRPFAQGRISTDAAIAQKRGLPSMQHNAADLRGPHRVIERRYHDGRPSGARDKGSIVDGPTSEGYTYELERPIAVPPAVGIKVNGAAVESGHRIVAQPGEKVTITPGRPLGAGETVEYRLLNPGGSTTSKSGSSFTVTAA